MRRGRHSVPDLEVLEEVARPHPASLLRVGSDEDVACSVVCQLLPDLGIGTPLVLEGNLRLVDGDAGPRVRPRVPLLEVILVDEHRQTHEPTGCEVFFGRHGVDEGRKVRIFGARQGSTCSGTGAAAPPEIRLRLSGKACHPAHHRVHDVRVLVLDYLLAVGKNPWQLVVEPHLFVERGVDGKLLVGVAVFITNGLHLPHAAGSRQHEDPHADEER
mmetsp:Transcript_66799/g.150848  ORF Transcript_66799/g.150848 Transcript_66799/m.150848 type:complete len:216 (+) Transcript_66799:328-975(+)